MCAQCTNPWPQGRDSASENLCAHQGVLAYKLLPLLTLAKQCVNALLSFLVQTPFLGLLTYLFLDYLLSTYYVPGY